MFFWNYGWESDLDMIKEEEKTMIKDTISVMEDKRL